MRLLVEEEIQAISGGSSQGYFFCFQQGDISSLQFCEGVMLSCYNNALYNPYQLTLFLHEVFDPCNNV